MICIYCVIIRIYALYIKNVINHLIVLIRFVSYESVHTS